MSVETGHFDLVPLRNTAAEFAGLVLEDRSDVQTLVQPFTPIGEPVGPTQRLLAASPGKPGELDEPLELELLVGKGPEGPIPFAALTASRNAAPQHSSVTPLPGLLLFCRKRACVFEARIVEDDSAARLRADASIGPFASVSESGAAVGASSPPAEPPGERFFEQLITSQGDVAALHERLAKDDPVRAAELRARHACCGCSERARCFPTDGGYAFAPDRLMPLGIAADNARLGPHAPWSLEAAAAVVGGQRPTQNPADFAPDARTCQAWRHAHAEQIETSGPMHLLLDEHDGRELLEAARLKLAMIAGVLRQLAASWKASGRPHLIWRGDTVRSIWRRPQALPASAWGFEPTLRFTGYQPASPIEAPGGATLPYPPILSDPDFLPPEIASAVRVFGQPRRATVFVKRAKAEGGVFRTTVLLESLHLPWEGFTTRDVMHVRAGGCKLTLSPLESRNPNDGDGLPFAGTAEGATQSLQTGEQLEGCECTWYPRFDESVDLFAVGMLLFQTLGANDQRPPAAYRAALLRERAEFLQTLSNSPVQQRDAAARMWAADRAVIDAPANPFARRNLLFREEDRQQTRPDALPTSLWTSIVMWGLRMLTSVAGFGYCESRAMPAPRTAGETLLPLLEVDGLIAMLDDVLFGRGGPARTAQRLLSGAHGRLPTSGDDE
ncbi:MAG: hypothetical protein HZB38_14725 [Planctomycetes bacterium]|nr:hypothetical protein [Planctomycetota bacterium]